MENKHAHLADKGLWWTVYRDWAGGVTLRFNNTGKTAYFQPGDDANRFSKDYAAACKRGAWAIGNFLHDYQDVAS
jgi:hypothetical protein